MSTLILFDVDGTLLAGSGPTHVGAFADALARLTGAPDPFTVIGEALAIGTTTVNGLVDAQIAYLCLEGAVGPDRAAELLPDFRVALIDSYRSRVADGGSCGTVLPGVIELLDELDRRKVAAGLVTGNTAEICAVKMETTGLAGRFVVGGFGGEIPDRAMLFEQALLQASTAGMLVRNVCYVGDTPLDVEAARRAGVPVVAVATGRHSIVELEGADAVLTDLSDTASVADVLCDTAEAKSPRAV